MDIGQIFNILFINPFTNVLVAIYQGLVFVHTPYPLGMAIIVLTIVIRFIMWPIIASQTRQMHKMHSLNPHLANIKEKHKGDKKRQQEEMMKLYKEHGVNPMAGCLPSIVQLVVFGSLYTTLLHFASANNGNAVAAINKALYFPALHLNSLDTTFFGISVSDSPQKLLSSMPFLVLIPLVTAATQFIFSKMMLPLKTKADREKESKKEVQADFASALQSQSMYIFPLMIGFFAFSLPIGMALYWNTFTIFGIIQQYLLVGSGSLKPWLEKVGIQNAR